MNFNRYSTFKNLKMKFTVTLNVPRYLTFEEDHDVTIHNDSFDFHETYFYTAGNWRLTLRLHGEGVYLEKEKI